MHDNRIRCGFPRGLNQPHLSDSVDRDVGHRIGLPTHVTGLRREVEDRGGALAQWAQIDLPYVAAHKLHPGTIEVLGVGAAAEQEPVQRDDARAPPRQLMAQIGAEEPGTAGNQNPAT